MQAHLAAAGDLLDFAQIAAVSLEMALAAVELGAGEQAAGYVVGVARGAETVDGLGEALGGLAEVPEGEGGAAQGQVVQGDVEEQTPRGRPLERLLSAPLCLGGLALAEQQVTIPIALERIEQRVFGLALLL